MIATPAFVVLKAVNTVKLYKVLPQVQGAESRSMVLVEPCSSHVANLGNDIVPNFVGKLKHRSLNVHILRLGWISCLGEVFIERKVFETRQRRKATEVKPLHQQERMMVCKHAYRG